MTSFFDVLDLEMSYFKTSGSDLIFGCGIISGVPVDAATLSQLFGRLSLYDIIEYDI